MNLYIFDISKIFYFLLLAVRVGSVFYTVPFVESRIIPNQVKILFVILLSMGIYPNLNKTHIELPESITMIAILIMGELFIGFIIGFITQIFMMCIYLGSEMISQQMGLSLATILNPNLNTNSSILTDFQYRLSILIFFSAYAHHNLILIIVESLKVVPILEFTLSSSVGLLLIAFLGKSFIFAIKIAAPMIATLIIVTVGIGIIARLVPQLNIFIISFPVNIGAGLLILSIMLFYFLNQFQLIFLEMDNALFSFLNYLSR